MGVGVFLYFLWGILDIFGVSGRGAITRGIFRGEGFVSSWQIFLLGVGHFTENFNCSAWSLLMIGVAGSSVPPASNGWVLV